MAYVICGLATHHGDFSHGEPFFGDRPSVRSDDSVLQRSSDHFQCLIYDTIGATETTGEDRLRSPGIPFQLSHG